MMTVHLCFINISSSLQRYLNFCRYTWLVICLFVTFINKLWLTSGSKLFPSNKVAPLERDLSRMYYFGSFRTQSAICWTKVWTFIRHSNCTWRQKRVCMRDLEWQIYGTDGIQFQKSAGRSEIRSAAYPLNRNIKFLWLLKLILKYGNFFLWQTKRV